MKISFDIFVRNPKLEIVRAYTGCKYTLNEYKSVQDVFVEATGWALTQVGHQFAFIDNYELLECNKDEKVELFDDYMDDIVKRIDCDPEFQGEEGLMAAEEKFSEDYLEIKYKGETKWLRTNN